MAEQDERERAPRTVPWGVLASLLVFAGSAVVMLGVIWLDANTSTGELIILIGVIVLLIGGLGVGLYLHSVRPEKLPSVTGSD